MGGLKNAAEVVLVVPYQVVLMDLLLLSIEKLRLRASSTRLEV